ncbi:unnamed protein product [Aphis gossypii]|uniref:MD-2-related lipid-recognition domain-containing protein n=1 Tax=Aphis gossypii TaxID=80765 RepID=A0A9P0NQD4_APHGO|nr:unnamed protein product [Aphis gossypii]
MTCSHFDAGEYRINYKAIIKCSSPKSGIESNFYLSKLSSDRAELRGNFTLKIPLDDNLTFDMNMAIKDSVGGWRDNAHLLKFPNACSTLKNLLGIEWRLFINSFGINSLNCPIAPGVYESSGYDLTAATVNSSFPKTFFYGTYKVRFHFSDKLNIAHGCSNFILEIKRPWEIE